MGQTWGREIKRMCSKRNTNLYKREREKDGKLDKSDSECTRGHFSITEIIVFHI